MGKQAGRLASWKTETPLRRVRGSETGRRESAANGQVHWAVLEKSAGPRRQHLPASSSLRGSGQSCTLMCIVGASFHRGLAGNEKRWAGKVALLVDQEQHLESDLPGLNSVLPCHIFLSLDKPVTSPSFNAFPLCSGRMVVVRADDNAYLKVARGKL